MGKGRRKNSKTLSGVFLAVYQTIEESASQ